MDATPSRSTEASPANEPVEVAFLGPETSYCHKAALSAFPEDTFRLCPAVGISGVFDQVQYGTATLGVVPIENSIAGGVTQTFNLLADREGKYPGLTVCGEIYIKIRHCLVGHIGPKTQSGDRGGGPDTPLSTPGAHSAVQPRSKPLYDVKHIKRIYSHTKALDQCVSFTSYYLENAETIETSSTSKAAEIVAEDSTGELAAICSTLTAERYKLTILARSIEDQEDNMTRFFILQKTRNNEPAISLSRFIPPPQAVEESKSIVWFRIAHETPGTLQRVLGCFSRQGINLTHIHSLPTLTHAFQYIFFVEFRELGPGASQGTRLALEQLGSLVQHWRYLGTWVDRSGAVV